MSTLVLTNNQIYGILKTRCCFSDMVYEFVKDLSLGQTNNCDYNKLKQLWLYYKVVKCANGSTCLDSNDIDSILKRVDDLCNCKDCTGNNILTDS